MRFKLFKKRETGGGCKRFAGLEAALGFTLIEIMIVVFIIAILSTAAVGGYTRYRKISLLELAADNIVSTIYQARDSAKMGSTVGVAEGAGSLCYGVLFDKNSGIPVRKVSVDFKKQKSWDSNLNKWGDGSCDTSGIVADFGEPIDLDDLVVIDMEKTSCWILFSPPNGDVSSTCGEDVLEIAIAYGEEVDESYQRTIKFNLKSGIANVE